MGRDMVVSRYEISTGIPRVNRLSSGPLGFGASHWKSPSIGQCVNLM